jgi:hypothetical protein
MSVNDQRIISNADVKLEQNSTFLANGNIILQSGMRIDTTSTRLSSYIIVDQDYIVPINTTNNILTISLPSIISTTGRIIIIVDVGGVLSSNNCTIDGKGKSINGSSTFVMTQNYMSITLWYNGTFWSMI